MKPVFMCIILHQVFNTYCEIIHHKKNRYINTIKLFLNFYTQMFDKNDFFILGLFIM